jgi:hypothetical protein
MAASTELDVTNSTTASHAVSGGLNATRRIRDAGTALELYATANTPPPTRQKHPNDPER